MLDLLIVMAFVLYGLGSGLRARGKASQSLDEYFLAGRTIKGWKAGFSMGATQFAADTPLLVTGLVATAGVFALWRLWIYGLAFLLMAFIFAVGWRRAGVLTDAELTCVRYSGKGVTPLRLLKAIYYGTVINCVVLAMVLVAAIRIAEVFLPWHLWLPAGLYEPIVALIANLGIQLGESITGLDPAMMSANNLISILLILAFTAMYSITGGLRAVVQTDVMQFSLAMIGTLLYAWFVVDAAGGLSGLTDRIVELYGSEQASRMLSFAPPADAGEALMPFLVIVGLQWFFQMNADGTGYLAQRSMACPTDRDARIAGLVFTWLQIFLRSLFWMAIAIGLLVLYPFTPGDMAGDGFTAGREALFVQGIEDLLPPGVRGLMLVGLLAALASTVDTHLNWGASYWSNDVYGGVFAPHVLKRKPKDRELVLVARFSNVLILVIAMIIMANLGSIQTAWFISLLFGAGMGSVLVLRWLWERINLYSELTAMAVSLITAPLLLYYLGTDPDREWVRLGIMALTTTSAAILVTFITPATDDATLKHFYSRVHPFGFWRRAAWLNGVAGAVSVKALGTRLFAVAVTAVSLFSLLVGVGRLMFPPPDGSSVISWVCIALGLLLVPVWLRIAMGHEFDSDPEDEPLSVEMATPDSSTS
ncbi:sodium transporter [Pseudomonas sp. Choline-3u-10]|jgi:Na+/proline symporter|uniref:sodium:solute symporter family protein n=1 Tax=Pseudomonadaceae TaxID=135621 RepID=UPI000617C2E9|nr:MULTISPECIES: sodium:solute symporter family protein [Pseudomonadaceae]MBU0948490.1 Na+:solute symporter [Gammaproteobacteria bacterium]HBM10504.1 sodium transporter [Pseudomonas sp.]KJJ64239.1 sodium transporter [Pseudomonas sp. 10B238]MBK3796645.1 sodium transporter [Stutzerimonas stutzeri]MBK3877148.1 sodium transporter [Stutzerimonas stutzeri]|tara:strand:+ start:2720 stop:4660 length:1941 start_codon:yes stop_codon:yes gene_type:complete